MLGVLVQRIVLPERINRFRFSVYDEQGASKDYVAVIQGRGREENTEEILSDHTRCRIQVREGRGYRELNREEQEEVVQTWVEQQRQAERESMERMMSNIIPRRVDDSGLRDMLARRGQRRPNAIERLGQGAAPRRLRPRDASQVREGLIQRNTRRAVERARVGVIRESDIQRGYVQIEIPAQDRTIADNRIGRRHRGRPTIATYRLRNDTLIRREGVTVEDFLRSRNTRIEQKNRITGEYEEIPAQYATIGRRELLAAWRTTAEQRVPMPGEVQRRRERRIRPEEGTFTRQINIRGVQYTLQMPENLRNATTVVNGRRVRLLNHLTPNRLVQIMGRSNTTMYRTDTGEYIDRPQLARLLRREQPRERRRRR